MSDINAFDSINFDFESESKSTLLIKNDDPFMRITIEDDCNDVYMKYEPLDRNINNLYNKTEKVYNPFVCPICSYEAGGGCSFQLHTMTHSERNFYTCNSYSCNYSATIGELVRHIFKDHITPEYCSGNSANKADYKGVDNKKVWKCDFCPYQTTNNSYLRLHLKTHRNII